MLSLKKFLWLKDSSTIFCDKGFQVNFVKEKYLISHTKDDRLALCGVRKAILYLADLNSGANDEDNYFYSKASPEEVIRVGRQLPGDARFDHVNVNSEKSGMFFPGFFAVTDVKALS